MCGDNPISVICYDDDHNKFTTANLLKPTRKQKCIAKTYSSSNLIRIGKRLSNNHDKQATNQDAVWQYAAFVLQATRLRRLDKGKGIAQSRFIPQTLLIRDTYLACDHAMKQVAMKEKVTAHFYRLPVSLIKGGFFSHGPRSLDNSQFLIRIY
ncbi:MAG: hypothetical protein ONB44_18435 [candidate division KSB1 bacterium]|nr:hypothetical protein [candidate division KSB1 bacterium]MDZ7304108.1 hypothetical protein [candidate division KSB1 bacterium]MDZ7313395.1 hypothetical protein [candidate division KSB1 bacterium]